MNSLISKYKKLSKWFQTSLGKVILNEEKNNLEKSFFKKIRGESLLILSDPVQSKLAQNSRFEKNIVFYPYKVKNFDLDDNLQLQNADYEKLPVFHNSVDAILLPHTLELVKNPDRLLRVLEKTLRSNGHLIIIGFNPISFFGLKRLFCSNTDFPFSLSFVYRVKKLLKLLNFEIISSDRVFYRLPINNKKILKLLKFMDYLGKYFLSFLGCVYVIVVKKNEIGLTPIKITWKKRLSDFIPSLIEPASKGVHSEQGS